MDKKRLGSFIVGGLVGAIAGVLFAPKSGRETRGNLADRAGEARQRSEETYFEARERLRERVSANREAHLRAENAPTASPGGARPSSPEPDERGPEPGTTGEERAGEKPVLRDVSFGREKDVPGPSGAGDRPEELRRKVRETRERLRSRAAQTGPEPQKEPDDDAR
ncbi:YtxH-like protein [Rubrobacter radiotolerans]|uniref:YtxH-like protein n=1 Tax=Rubrobacter radiotolerans TaxID=42256 RepID=A0A023X1J3_RUBRA|nr:YtxH-like protein [Rubrobacter radiotolerans]SMC03548.1 YtxH-like protein [Rubrobacter radiotolerans DSM 5868]